MSTRARIRKTTDIPRGSLGNDGAPRYRRLAIIALLLTTIFPGSTPSVQAFEVAIHGEITREGLGSSPDDSFLRTAVRRSINHQHRWMDEGFPTSLRGAEDQRHFDDCEFDGAAAFIRDYYRVAQNALTADRFWATTFMFGNILHTVQDFYSHSNWVELGFPISSLSNEVFQSDLVDLSGAQLTLAQHWFAPDGGEVVRGDILLGGDDWEGLPAGWSIERNGGGLFIPTLVDAESETRGRLLETGQGTADDECDVSTPAGPDYTGIKHDNLNKDGPKSRDKFIIVPQGTTGPIVFGTRELSPDSMPHAEQKKQHDLARALATLQTSYEWCRLVHEAGLVDQDGLLLALWVRDEGNPHPPDTPCGPDEQGSTQVVVTIESIRILNARDGGDDPGEIQLAAVLYDDPLNFHSSVHVTNRQGRMQLRTGDFVPNNQIPAPLSLWVPQGSGATFALHAWDNDDPLNDQYGLDFDNYDDDDEVLFGFQVAFGEQPPNGIQVARAGDLEVRYRVSRIDAALLMLFL